MSQTELIDAVQMNPEHLALWLAGVMDMMDDEPPSKEQWAMIREQVAQVVGRLTAERLCGHTRPPRPSYDLGVGSIPTVNTTPKIAYLTNSTTA